MPGLNGTGPMGMGPRTGRGMGACPPGAGGAVYGGAVRGLGRGGLPWGCGMGFGGGRGRGRGFRGRGLGYGAWAGYVPGAYGVAAGAASVEQEAAALRAEAEAMRQGLAEVERRIAELDSAQQGDDK